MYYGPCCRNHKPCVYAIYLLHRWNVWHFSVKQVKYMPSLACTRGVQSIKSVSTVPYQSAS
jgi:hypothetical protein